MDRRRLWSGAAVGLLVIALPSVAAAPASPADDFGRLFTSPSERMEIDRARASFRHAGGDSATAAATSSPAIPAPSGRTRVDGLLRRGDGTDELWLNGGRVKAAGGVDEKNRIQVTVPGTDRKVWMKPGQVLDAVSGAVRESYQSGRDGR